MPSDPQMEKRPRKKREYQCPDCDKILTTSEGLNIHRRLHTGEKPYVCEICKHAFSRKWNYTCHLKGCQKRHLTPDTSLTDLQNQAIKARLTKPKQVKTEKPTKAEVSSDLIQGNGENIDDIKKEVKTSVELPFKDTREPDVCEEIVQKDSVGSLLKKSEPFINDVTEKQEAVNTDFVWSTCKDEKVISTISDATVKTSTIPTSVSQGITYTVSHSEEEHRPPAQGTSNIPHIQEPSGEETVTHYSKITDHHLNSTQAIRNCLTASSPLNQPYKHFPNSKNCTVPQTIPSSAGNVIDFAKQFKIYKDPPPYPGLPNRKVTTTTTTTKSAIPGPISHIIVVNGGKNIYSYQVQVKQEAALCVEAETSESIINTNNIIDEAAPCLTPAVDSGIYDEIDGDIPTIKAEADENTVKNSCESGESNVIKIEKVLVNEKKKQFEKVRNTNLKLGFGNIKTEANVSSSVKETIPEYLSIKTDFNRNFSDLHSEVYGNQAFSRKSDVEVESRVESYKTSTLETEIAVPGKSDENATVAYHSVGTQSCMTLRNRENKSFKRLHELRKEILNGAYVKDVYDADEIVDPEPVSKLRKIENKDVIHIKELIEERRRKRDLKKGDNSYSEIVTNQKRKKPEREKAAAYRQRKIVQKSYTNCGFECKVCGKLLTTPYGLQNHLMVHEGQKPFVCKVCNHAFTKQWNLKTHLQNRHKIEPTKKDLEPKAPVNLSTKGAYLRRVSREDIPEGISAKPKTEAVDKLVSVSEKTVSKVKVESVEGNLLDSEKLEKSGVESLSSDKKEFEKEPGKSDSSFDNTDLIDEYLNVNDIENSSFEGSEDNIFDLNEADFLEIKQLETDVDLETMVNKGTVIGADDACEHVTENVTGHNMANENVTPMEKSDVKTEAVQNGALEGSKQGNYGGMLEKNSAGSCGGITDKTLAIVSETECQKIPEQDLSNMNECTSQKNNDLKKEVGVNQTEGDNLETNKCMNENRSAECAELKHASVQDVAESQTMALQKDDSDGAMGVMPNTADNVLEDTSGLENQETKVIPVNNDTYSENDSSFNTGPLSSTERNTDLISSDSSQVEHKEQSLGAAHQNDSLPPPPYSEAVQSVPLPPGDPYSHMLNSRYPGHPEQYMQAHYPGQPDAMFDQNMYSAHLASLAQHSEETDGLDPSKDKQMVECPTCGKKLTSAGALQTHMRIHTGEKPYRCEICNRAFSFKSNCTRHMLTHTQGRQKKSPPKGEGKPTDGESVPDQPPQALLSFGDLRSNTEMYAESDIETSPMLQPQGMLPSVQALVSNQAEAYAGMPAVQLPNYSQTSTSDTSQERSPDMMPKPEDLSRHPYGISATEYQHQQHQYYHNHQGFYDHFGQGMGHYRPGAYPPPMSPMHRSQLGTEYHPHVSSQQSFMPEPKLQQHPEHQASTPSPQQAQQVQRLPSIELKPETPFKQKNRSKEYQGERKHPSKYCEICKKSFSASYYTNHMKMHSGTSPHICTLCNQVFSQKFSLTRHIENIHHKGKQDPAQVKVIPGAEVNQQVDAAYYTQSAGAEVKINLGREQVPNAEGMSYPHSSENVLKPENGEEGLSKEDVPSIELSSCPVPGLTSSSCQPNSSKSEYSDQLALNQLQSGQPSRSNPQNIAQFQERRGAPDQPQYQSQTSRTPESSTTETPHWPTSLPSIHHLQQLHAQGHNLQQLQSQGHNLQQVHGHSLQQHQVHGQHLLSPSNHQQELPPGLPASNPTPPSTQSSLEEGEPDHSGGQQQPVEKVKGSHICTVCNNTYSSAATLKAHHRIHTGEKPYTCSFCDKSFTFKGNMKQHMKKHHKDALPGVPGGPALEGQGESLSGENSLLGMKTPTKKSRKSPVPVTASPGFGFQMSETPSQFDIPSQEYRGYCNSPLYKHPVASDPEPYVSMQPAMYSYQSRSPMNTLGTRTPPQLYPTPPPQSFSGSPVKSLPSIHNFNKLSSNQTGMYAHYLEKTHGFSQGLGPDMAPVQTNEIKQEPPTTSSSNREPDGLPVQIANAVLGMQQEGLGGSGIHPPEYPAVQHDLKNWQDHSFPPVPALKTEENENSNIAPSIGDLEKTVMPLTSEESQSVQENQSGIPANTQASKDQFESAVSVSQAHDLYSQSGSSLHQTGKISQSKPQVNLDGQSETVLHNYQQGVPVESPALLQSPNSVGTPLHSPHPSTPGTPIISPHSNPFGATVSPHTGSTGNPLTSPKQKSIICPVCNKELAYSSSLSTHMRVHTGEKPFSCPLCSKTFAQRSNLNTHLKSCRKKNESKEGTPEFVGAPDGHTVAGIPADLSDLSAGESLSRKPSTSSDVSSVNYDMAMDLSQHHGNQHYPSSVAPPPHHMQNLGDYSAHVNYENQQAGLNMHLGQYPNEMYAHHPNAPPPQQQYTREVETDQFSVNSAIHHQLSSESMAQPSSSAGNALPNFSSVFSSNPNQGFQFPQQQLPGFDSFKSSYKGDTLPLPQEFPTDLTEKPINMSLHPDLTPSPTKEPKVLPSISDWGTQLKPDQWLSDTKPKPVKPDGRRRSSTKVLSDEDKTAARTCKICKKVLSCLAGLRHHMRIHTGEKPFRCGLCNKRFSQKCNTHTHIKSCIKTQMSKGNLSDEHLTKSEQDLCILFTIQEPESKWKSSVEESGESEASIDQQEEDSNSRFGNEFQGDRENMAVDIVSKGNTEDGKSNTELVKQALMDIIDKVKAKESEAPGNGVDSINCSSIDNDISEIDENDRLTPKFLDKEKIRGVDSGYKKRKCSECGIEIAGTPTSLKDHMKTHTKEKPFVCDYCCRPFSMKFSLNRHINTQHGENRHESKKVEKRKLNADDKINDYSTLSEAKLFKSECFNENVGESGSSMETKEPGHERPGYEPLNDIKSETSTEAQNCEGSLEYPDKGSELTRVNDVKHKIVAGESEKSVKQETVCEGVENSVTVLDAGVVKTEMKQDTKVKVKKSKYPIIDEAAIAAMEITKRGLKVCEICNKEFARPVLLLKHMRVHTNAEKPFKCVMCNKSFGYKSSLKTHFEKHKAEMFKCNVCEELYTTESELAEHSVSHSWDDCPDIDAV